MTLAAVSAIVCHLLQQSTTVGFCEMGTMLYFNLYSIKGEAYVYGALPAK